MIINIFWSRGCWVKLSHPGPQLNPLLRCWRASCFPGLFCWCYTVTLPDSDVILSGVRPSSVPGSGGEACGPGGGGAAGAGGRGEERGWGTRRQGATAVWIRPAACQGGGQEGPHPQEAHEGKARPRHTQLRYMRKWNTYHSAWGVWVILCCMLINAFSLLRCWQSCLVHMLFFLVVLLVNYQDSTQAVHGRLLHSTVKSSLLTAPSGKLNLSSLTR